MHQAESSSSLFCLWTGLLLPAALHPASRRRSCLRLRTGQCSRPIGTFTLLLVRTLRRTPRPRSALLLLRPLSAGRFASLRFRPKNMAHHIFQLESELQTIPEASRSFSVSEKLARYGSSALSGVEHLTLLVGKKSVALALIRHFGSLKGLARASFQELRQFLPRRSAEAVVAALSMSVIAETEHARSEQLDNPESIYRAGTDMKLFS